MSATLSSEAAHSERVDSQRVNDFSIQVATVNGSGSQTANSVLMMPICSFSSILSDAEETAQGTLEGTNATTVSKRQRDSDRRLGPGTRVASGSGTARSIHRICRNAGRPAGPADVDFDLEGLRHGGPTISDCDPHAYLALRT